MLKPFHCLSKRILFNFISPQQPFFSSHWGPHFRNPALPAWCHTRTTRCFYFCFKPNTNHQPLFRHSTTTGPQRRKNLRKASFPLSQSAIYARNIQRVTQPAVLTLPNPSPSLRVQNKCWLCLFSFARFSSTTEPSSIRYWALVVDEIRCRRFRCSPLPVAINHLLTYLIICVLSVFNCFTRRRCFVRACETNETRHFLAEATILAWVFSID